MKLFIQNTMIVVFLLCFCPYAPAFAQISPTPAIMAMVNSELNKRGLTQDEVQARLLREGIDPNNIPMKELPSYQGRVMAILDKMQQEKATQAVTTAQNPATLSAPADSGLSSVVPPALPPASAVASVAPSPDAAPITTQAEAVSEAKQRVYQTAETKKGDGASIYGHAMYTNQSLDAFRTTDGAQVPENYILGEGDEIRITIFGASQTDIQQKINESGFVQPVGIAKIYLKGLTIAMAREIIKKRLSSVYTFREDQIAVTIVTTRTILVNIFGETKITGGFTMSALNSALNALSASGGPTSIGSVRAIQHIRAGTTKIIDTYAFMTDPTMQYKYDLQQNDIIFVPIAKTLVTIDGAVKRPMTYEILEQESLLDLIKFAGNVKTDALPDYVQIHRFLNGEEVIKEWNLADVIQGKIKVPLLNGDSITIKSINKPMLNFVEIEGSVYYPGKYELENTTTLAKIIDKAKPNVQARRDILFIERIRSDKTTEYLTVPFPSLQGSNKNEFELKSLDKIRILDQQAYRDINSIQVNGNVRAPFSKEFALNDKLTVSRAIEMAGGLKTSVYPVAYIYRQNLFNTAKTEYIRIKLEEAKEVYLQPGDQLNIYDNSRYSNIGEVKIYGAVKSSQGFTYDPSLTLRDILTNVGGFTIGAAYNRIEVYRTLISTTDQVKFETIFLKVDSTYQITNNPGFILHPYDQICVRNTPNFILGRTIELNGSVNYPGVYPLTKEFSLSEIIDLAGGLLPDADLTGSSLFRTFKSRGLIGIDLKESYNRSLNNKFDPILFEGDVININRRENVVAIREIGTKVITSINGSDNGKLNVIFQGRKSAKWYIRKYAGGFNKDADRNTVSVILPNKQMKSTKRLFFFRHYPTVEAGSLITINLEQPPTPDVVQSKKTDWQAFWQQTMSAMTAILTILVVSKQL